jgi:hypothetical protein
MERLLLRVAGPHETVAAEFRGAELVRDSLGAPALATSLFLDLVRRHPESLFAPKALVAALALDPPERDSIVAVLESTYAASPYARAFRGDPSAAYAAVEDSLGRALGLALVAPLASGAWAAAAPTPGPRGPSLDEPAVRAGGAGAAAGAAPTTPGAPGTPGRPSPRRPGARPRTADRH